MRLSSFQCHNHYHKRGLAYPCLTSSKTVTETQMRLAMTAFQLPKHKQTKTRDILRCASNNFLLCLLHAWLCDSCVYVCVVLQADCLATTYPCTDGPRWGHPKPGTKSQKNKNESKHTHNRSSFVWNNDIAVFILIFPSSCDTAEASFQFVPLASGKHTFVVL